VRDLYLGDRHLTQYVDLFEQLYQQASDRGAGEGMGSGQ
jgi:trehalose synthase